MGELIKGLPLPVDVVIAAVSLAVLIISADLAISRAVQVAHHYRISPLIIGTTLVAMSTSLAELAVNMAVTLSGADNSIVVGNVLGSNLVNIGLGLGIAGFIIPIRTSTLVIEREFVLYFAITALLTSFALGGVLSHGEGVVLVFSFVIVVFLIYQYAARSRQEIAAVGSSEDMGAAPGVGNAFYMILALVALVLAAEGLVESVSVLAEAAGVSPYIIGLTIVGIGTSLPEIATSIQAARRGHVDLVLGNVFGSNVFNICIALGLPVLIRAVHLPVGAVHDIYFLNLYGLVVIFLLLGEYRFLGASKVIGRWGAVLIVATYLGYLGYKVATGY